MTLPLVVLAALAVGSGFFGGDLAEMWSQQYDFEMGTVGGVATLLAVAGGGLAWLVYGRRSVPDSALAWLAPLGRLARSGAVDRLWVHAYHEGLLRLARTVAWVDRYLVDGLINTLGYATIRGGQRLRTVQSGDVQGYVYAVIAGTIALISWGLW